MRALKAVFFISLTIVVLSCSDQYGPMVTEDYADAWLTMSFLGIDEVSEMTDTTFESFVQYQGLGGYVPAYKGFIRKESETQIYVVTTHIYVMDNYTVDGSGFIIPGSSSGYYEPVENVNTDYAPWIVRASMNYSVSGDTLTIDGNPMTRTAPVSDNLLQ